MEVRINPRENGACPFCRKAPSCVLRQRLERSVKDLKDEQKHGLEMVIYSCPLFEERF
jgi:hypothetical protein